VTGKLPFKKQITMVRKAIKDDFNFFYRLYMHPQVNPFLLYEPMDEKEFEPIYTELLKNGVLYVYELNGKSVGMFKLVPLTYRTSHVAYLGGLGIDPEFSGKGQGYQMLNEILELGGKLGFLRIELSVAVHNEKAIHLYEKSGFQKEGVLRKYSHLKKENVFWDEALMAYLY
jgi:L-phenylalanine/L-methionine N-acetyltransferase